MFRGPSPPIIVSLSGPFQPGNNLDIRSEILSLLSECAADFEDKDYSRMDRWLELVMGVIARRGLSTENAAASAGVHRPQALAMGSTGTQQGGGATASSSGLAASGSSSASASSAAQALASFQGEEELVMRPSGVPNFVLMCEVASLAADKLRLSEAPLLVQMQWVNLFGVKFVPTPSLGYSVVERYLNLVKNSMRNQHPWGRAVACMLYRRLAHGLNPSGQQLVAQVTIVIKNLYSTLRDCRATAAASLSLPAGAGGAGAAGAGAVTAAAAAAAAASAAASAAAAAAAASSAPSSTTSSKGSKFDLTQLVCVAAVVDVVKYWAGVLYDDQADEPELPAENAAGGSSSSTSAAAGGAAAAAAGVGPTSSSGSLTGSAWYMTTPPPQGGGGAAGGDDTARESVTTHEPSRQAYAPLVSAALKELFNLLTALSPPATRGDFFLRYCVADGIRSLLGSRGVWPSLSRTMTYEVYKNLLRATKDFHAGNLDDISATLILRAFDGVVFDDVLHLPNYLGAFISQVARVVKPVASPISRSSPSVPADADVLLDLRFAALRLLGRFIACPDCRPRTASPVRPGLPHNDWEAIAAGGCTRPAQVERLHSLLHSAMAAYIVNKSVSPEDRPKLVLS
jgi:hypothetical protein